MQRKHNGYNTDNLTVMPYSPIPSDSREQGARLLVVIDVTPVHGPPGVVGGILSGRPAERLVELELQHCRHEAAENQSNDRLS